MPKDTLIRGRFQALECKWTVPARATALRKWKADPPITTIARTWTGLEFASGSATRTLPKAYGLDVQQGGKRLPFALNANAKRVSRLLASQTDTGTDNDADELIPCQRVLETWSEEPDPGGALPAHWQPVIQSIADTVPGVLVEYDDPLAGDV